MEATEFKYMVPPTREERNHLRSTIAFFLKQKKLTPPVSMNKLSDLATEMMQVHHANDQLKGWLMVEINNGIWFNTVSSIPHDKRVLLLPKCLSNSQQCKADIDDLGLLCNLCHHCSIPDIQTKAEELGMMSLVAEGFTSVIGLVKSGAAQAVIGVSCLDSLEKAFPLLINNAVPGLAIPLNEDGCKNTTVDEDYLEMIINMKSDNVPPVPDYDQLKSQIHKWFKPDNLQKRLSPSVDQTSIIARNWMSNDGNRWRPYLLTATYMALSGKKEIPEQIELAAIAIECFHKASLVHDDIQDDDLTRYGKETVNAAYGVPIAINVGDAYLGEGYRLLAQCQQLDLIKVAADAHIALCKGQGMEMEWVQNPQSLSMQEVLNIFRHKTVPAFEVSLLMGSICVNDDKKLQQTLSTYSEALGIAYQLKDDLEDYDTDSPVSIRPSAVLATICQLKPDEQFINSIFQYNELKPFLKHKDNADLLNKAISQVKQMVSHYHMQALDTINELTNSELKQLLFRVTQKILK